MKKVALITALIFSIFIEKSFTQTDINIVEELVYNEDFTNAIDLYRKILQQDSLNPQLNFELGFCYLNTILEKEKAIHYLKAAIELYPRKQRKSIEYFESQFYLGRAYRINYRFEEAVTLLELLRTKVNNKKFQSAIDNEIALCKRGIEFINEPIKIDVLNLGPTVNSAYTDHSPVISADESTLIFTSRRPYKGGEQQPDGQYDENLYVCIKQENGLWSTPQSIGNKINTADHEASIGLSYDGQLLLIYKEEDEGSIFYSTQETDGWSEPIKLNDNINTKYRETSATLSVDGKKLYFVSDRPGGQGGKDIYVSHLQANNTWGPAQNLGPKVNSTDDEEGPYIHPDGKTLYFSSKGHNGIGGYDIYRTESYSNGTWSDPLNMGYPINTIEDDVFYIPTPDGQRAYYSSVKQKSVGRSDIFIMGLPEIMKTGITIMSGVLTVCKGNLPAAEVTITDNTTGEISGIAKPNKAGKFIFLVKGMHNYTVSVLTLGKVVFVETFDVPLNTPEKQMYKSIRLDPEVPCNNLIVEEVKTTQDDLLVLKRTDEEGNIYDKFVEIENILFSYGKADFIEQSNSLDELAEYLLRNTEATIEIGAYADAQGKADANQKLAAKRGIAVKKYLTDKGVDPIQIEVIGYGEENPIAINRNKAGKWIPEAQKYNRRIEFRVLVQGDQTLLIRPITTVPEQYKNAKYNPKYVKSKLNTTETTI